MTIRIGVAGVNGRMGQSIVHALCEDQGAIFAGGLVREKAPPLSMAENALITDDLKALLNEIDVLIDFSAADAAVATIVDTAQAGVASVIGVTGFSDEQEAAISGAAAKTPIVKSGNMSLGVNLLAGLVEEAAARLGEDFDLEITEAHHRAKVDAPSGTALLLGEAAAAGRGAALADKAVYTREGQTGARNAGDIGFAVTRGGGIVGDHAVSLISQDEMITLSHRALDRRLFANGAIAAAKWAKGQAPGLYNMRHVLGLAPR